MKCATRAPVPAASSSTASTSLATTATPQESVTSLLQSGSWELASLRAQSHPHECDPNGLSQISKTPALALACRLAAPLSCIRSILQACPSIVRSGGGLARGTPLHEAISNSRVTLDVISLLIQTDEELDSSHTDSPSSTSPISSKLPPSSSSIFQNNNPQLSPSKTERAALTQDVDGQIPLHLLVRRYFYFHPQDETRQMIELLSQLISSCPKACAMPDKRDFEESPLVLALKANMYAHYDTAVAAAAAATSATIVTPTTERPVDSSIARSTNEPNDGGESCSLTSLLEEKIHTITNLMITLYPQSASNGPINLDYTPLHSAVYHGRCKEIIQYLLQANPPATMCANEGRLETPLHFAAMRGESEEVISTLVSTSTGRMAVEMLDHRGLTPVHWLWIRLIKEAQVICAHVSNLEKEHEAMDSTTIKKLAMNMQNEINHLWHSSSTSISLQKSKDDSLKLNSTKPKVFDEKYFRMMKELDPPLDYRQMRHLPSEYTIIDPDCTSAVIFILKRIISKYSKLAKDQNNSTYTSHPLITELQSFDRTETMILLFWKKVECLLQAAAHAKTNKNHPKNTTATTTNELPILHAAAASICCPPSILYIALSLRSDQLSAVDNNGNLPLHHAAMRPIHCWELASSPSPPSYHTAFSRYPLPYHPELPSVQNTLDENNDNGEDDNMITFETFQNEKNGIIIKESSLPLVLSHSCRKASQTCNNDNRLPLHLAIDNILDSYASITFPELVTFSSSTTSSSLEYYWRKQVSNPLHFLESLLKSFPLALERRDGVTKLYPFMQAAAKSTDILMRRGSMKSSSCTSTSTVSTSLSSNFSSSESPSTLMSSLLLSRRKQKSLREDINEMENQFTLFALNVTYSLLRENPMLVNIGASSLLSSVSAQNFDFNIEMEKEFECPDAKRARIDE